MDFGAKPARQFSAQLRVPGDKSRAAAIELRLGALNNPVISRLATSPHRRRLAKLQDQRQAVTGVHDLFLVFQGQGAEPLLELDHWRFQR